jgi:hypothetical protein
MLMKHFSLSARAALAWFAASLLACAATAQTNQSSTTTTTATAAETNRYSAPIWSLVDAKKVIAAAADITPAKFPDCDDATV